MPWNFSSPNQKIITVTEAYTVQDGDDLILVDATAAPVTITLPDPQGRYAQTPQLSDKGMVAVVKTDAGGNAVTVAAAAGSIIGISSLAAQEDGALYMSDGVSKWYNFSKA